MNVRHLNTGTMCPIGRRLVNGSGGLFERARMVCHCLLIETGDGLALVDTGIGLGDIADPKRLGSRWLRQTAPRLDPAETAVQQIKALGYSPDDVRHLLLTHLDRDHAGGVPDFPKAKVHVRRREYEMAVLGKLAAPKGRYVSEQWQHGPDWALHGEGGEDWFGFKSVRALSDREPDVLMIPLPGHTLGHCGIAVRTRNGWLLPAMPISPTVSCCRSPRRRSCSAISSAGSTWIAPRGSPIRSGCALKAAHGHTVTIFNSHDPVDYETCCRAGPSANGTPNGARAATAVAH
jgi:glyoxylase-like metal-dependent hydrolase (beta-lactamase superfamily II)